MTVVTSVAAGLYVFGFGGHARSVVDVAYAAGYRQIVFVDPNVRPGENFGGFSAVTALASAEPDWLGHVALGDSARRRDLTETLSIPLATLIAPSATIGIEAILKGGVFVGHHAHVGPAARIGRGVIINTGASVDHETIVGSFSHVAVGATVAGRCRIGDNCMIGAGAAFIDGISIGDNIVVGAGATVVADLAVAGTYVGTPARRIERP